MNSCIVLRFIIQIIFSQFIFNNCCKNIDPVIQDKLSFNKWEATNLGNDAQTEKFRRLMGIKTDKPPQVGKYHIWKI